MKRKVSRLIPRRMACPYCRKEFEVNSILKKYPLIRLILDLNRHLGSFGVLLQTHAVKPISFHSLDLLGHICR
jgi:hypothetical protein